MVWINIYRPATAEFGLGKIYRGQGRARVNPTAGHFTLWGAYFCGLLRDDLYCLSSTRNGPMCMEASKKFGLIGNNLFPSNEKTGKKVGLLPNRRFIRFIWSLSAENLQILCARCGKTTGPTTLLHIPRVHICSVDFTYTWHCFEAVTVSE